MKRPGPAVVVTKGKSLAKTNIRTGIKKKETCTRKRGEMTLAKKNQ
jgi:hypothetical protein